MTTPPTVAQNAGYTRLSFSDDFDGSALSSQWYKHCWFLAGDTNSDSISLANSILTLFGGSGSNGSIPALIRLTSAFAVGYSPFYNGQVFRNGGYFEASLRFDPSASGTAANRPAFWSLAIEHVHAVEDNFVAEHWPGQASNYYNYAEFDFAEAAKNSEGTDHYLASVHNWNGLNGANDYLNSNYKSFPASTDWTVFHTYGALWIPQGSNAYGKIEFYYDGVLINSVYYKGPADDITATNGTVLVDQSTAALAGLPFSVLDRQGVAISLQADVNWKIEVDWVRVWQPGYYSPAIGWSTIPLVDYGSLLYQLAKMVGAVREEGTATGGSTTTLIDTANLAGMADDDVNGLFVFIWSGTGAGQQRRITDFTGSTETATVPTWTSPDTTSKYIVFNQHWRVEDLEAAWIAAMREQRDYYLLPKVDETIVIDAVTPTYAYTIPSGFAAIEKLVAEHTVSGGDFTDPIPDDFWYIDRGSTKQIVFEKIAQQHFPFFLDGAKIRVVGQGYDTEPAVASDTITIPTGALLQLAASHAHNMARVRDVQNAAGHGSLASIFSQQWLSMRWDEVTQVNPASRWVNR